MPAQADLLAICTVLMRRLAGAVAHTREEAKRSGRRNRVCGDAAAGQKPVRMRTSLWL
jgi:orotate phosphoribosyltransferase